MTNKHYGTVSHWFDDRRIGAIKPDKNIGQHILLIASHLSGGCVPEIGDEVSYEISKDERNRLCATAVEILPKLREGMQIKVHLGFWDFALNGGYGLYQRATPIPVFILGPFLQDQTRVPDEGEELQGILVQHDNGQWLLTDIEVLPSPPKPAVTLSSQQPQPQKMPAAGAAAPRKVPASKPLSAGGLPLNKVLHGEVVRWEDDKGYGFIQCGIDSVFFHISAYHYRSRRPQMGETVSFFCRLPAKNGEKQRADRVVRQQDEYALNWSEPLAGAEKINIRKVVAYTAAGILYLAALAFLFWPLAAWNAVASLAALLLYGYDKAIAKNSAGRRGYLGRTSEKRLLAVGLLGGWPGALAARFGFNHKTTKQPFVLQFWLTVAANIALSVWLLWSDVPDRIVRLPGW